MTIVKIEKKNVRRTVVLVIRLTQWTPSRNMEFFINCEEEGRKKKTKKKIHFHLHAKNYSLITKKSFLIIGNVRFLVEYFCIDFEGGMWVHVCPWNKLLYLQLLDDPTLTPLPSDEICDISHYYAFSGWWF